MKTLFLSLHFLSRTFHFFSPPSLSCFYLSLSLSRTPDLLFTISATNQSAAAAATGSDSLRLGFELAHSHGHYFSDEPPRRTTTTRPPGCHRPAKPASNPERPSTSTSRRRRPPSTSPTVTGCRVDDAGA